MNTISGAEFGVSVAAFVLGFGFSNCDPSVGNNKVVNNSISAASFGDTGVFVGTGFAFGGDLTGFTGSAVNNKVIRNIITGFATDTSDGGFATKVRANVSNP